MGTQVNNKIATGSDEKEFDLWVAAEQRGDFLMGLFDVLLHVGLALREAGFVSTEGLVGAMDGVCRGIDRQSERLGLPKDGPDQIARKLPAKILGEVFAMPCAGERSFSVIAGGKTEPPAGAA